MKITRNFILMRISGASFLNSNTLIPVNVACAMDCSLFPVSKN